MSTFDPNFALYALFMESYGIHSKKNLLFGPFKMLQNHHFDPTSTCLFRQLYHLFHAISSRRDALCEKQNCI